jgi:hypothetical protein
MTRLCDRHTAKWKPCPKCTEALTQLILYASRQGLFNCNPDPEAKA